MTRVLTRNIMEGNPMNLKMTGSKTGALLKNQKNKESSED